MKCFGNHKKNNETRWEKVECCEDIYLLFDWLYILHVDFRIERTLNNDPKTLKCYMPLKLVWLFGIMHYNEAWFTSIMLKGNTVWQLWITLRVILKFYSHLGNTWLTPFKVDNYSSSISHCSHPFCCQLLPPRLPACFSVFFFEPYPTKSTGFHNPHPIFLINAKTTPPYCNTATAFQCAWYWQAMPPWINHISNNHIFFSLAG